MLLHISAFHLDRDSGRRTVWQRLLPQTRLVCSLLLVFAIALTPNGHWWTWATYAVVLLSLIVASRVTLSVLLRRLAIEFLFISVVLLGTLFRSGGAVVWQWGTIQITTAGLTVLGSVALKALLSLTLLNLLTLTTSIPALLQAMVVLRVPPLLIAIFAAMYRYLDVLIDEFNTMRRAAISRNLMSNPRWQRLVLGNMIGSLFIRTYERGERIHQAMLSRGYQGLPPIQDLPPVQGRDILTLTLTCLVCLLGQALYLTDLV